MNTYRNQWHRAWRTFFSYHEYDQTPQWLRLLLTVLFSMGIAAIFTVVGFVLFAQGEGAWRNWRGWLEWYGRNLVVALTVGLLIYAAFYMVYTWFGEARLRAMPFTRRRWLFSMLPLVVTAFGWPLGVMLAGGDFSNMFASGNDSNSVARTVLTFFLIAFVFNAIFANKARAIEAERRETEARLQLLQAQIEPHFLFNTLAGVISLIDHDPTKAKTTLQAFTDYLRSSMSNLRNRRNPLEQELEMVENYLRVAHARMEDRLTYRIDAHADARRVAVPPLLLQPLVENAVLHGLEPALAGGHVAITARVEAGMLVLHVKDDGRGLNSPPRPGKRAGNGLALANIRARLESIYGGMAQLDVSAATPGTVAVLKLPL
jgi:two-component sensor histidine kinase